MLLVGLTDEIRGILGLTIVNNAMVSKVGDKFSQVVRVVVSNRRIFSKGCPSAAYKYLLTNEKKCLTNYIRILLLCLQWMVVHVRAMMIVLQVSNAIVLLIKDMWRNRWEFKYWWWRSPLCILPQWVLVAGTTVDAQWFYSDSKTSMFSFILVIVIDSTPSPAGGTYEKIFFCRGPNTTW